MRGDVIHLVYGVHGGRAEDVYFGGFRTRAEADACIAGLRAKEMHGRNWAAAHHDRGFVVRTRSVDSDFELPTRPKPRDRYCVRLAKKSHGEGRWPGAHVEVLERTPGGLVPRARYDRNHGMYATFEPFRQHGRDYALVSHDYTRTSVLDIATGEIIADEAEIPDGYGFCPVGFYVPDWWDLNDDSILPGSPYWNVDHEWPDGTGGFVWGCIWGDDSSWKVQWLDLSRVREGVLVREERFGYLELATGNWASPCLSLEPPPDGGSKPPPFIDVSRDQGKTRVRFEIEMDFDLDSGKPVDWQRLRVLDFE